MDIQQYISSGVIEAYILGIASDQEVRELELLSMEYPEIEAAITNCRQIIEDYASLHTVDPPKELKGHIWARLEKEKSSWPAKHTDSTIDLSFNVKSKGRKVLLYRSLAASIALMLISIAINFTLWNRSMISDKKISDLKDKQSKLTADNQQYQQQLRQSSQSFQLLIDPAVKSIYLSGVGEHTTNSAVVLWDGRSKDVYLSFKNMPPPPKGKQYQLWAIVDGKPVDLGVYSTNLQTSLQKMKSIHSAQMFAVTLEKEGGSAVPTLDQMFVAGKAS